MRARLPFYLLFMLSSIVITACASTTVKKDPKPCDRGIRFYRPKPYLLIQPPTDGSDEYVTIALQYLPDFAEEYSIHIRTGIGKNKTSVTLDNGWNLTKLDVDIDSEVPQNIEAVGKLISSIAPKGLIGATATPPGQRTTVKATNVPMGYYEAVVSPGPDGKKRLYGWRYVGFAPYAQCPIESGGLEQTCCQNQAVFGLVFENGVMVFKPITAIGFANTERNPPTQAPGVAEVPQDFKTAALAGYKTVFPDTSIDDLGFELASLTTFKVVAKKPSAEVVKQVAADKKVMVSDLEVSIAATIKKKLEGTPLGAYSVQVVLPK